MYFLVCSVVLFNIFFFGETFSFSQDKSILSVLKLQLPCFSCCVSIARNVLCEPKTPLIWCPKRRSLRGKLFSYLNPQERDYFCGKSRNAISSASSLAHRVKQNPKVKVRANKKEHIGLHRRKGCKRELN